jgi:hypothetical protein
MTRHRTAKTHFVPKIIFKTTFAGVVPLCVAATACGGKVNPGGSPPGAVAAMAFGDAGGGAEDAALGAVAANGFGVGNAAFGDGGIEVLSVACTGFACGVGPTVASAGFGDGGLIGPPGVAVTAFGDGGDGIDAADAAQASEPPDAHLFVVACIGFGGDPCGAPDAGEGQPFLTVAAIGFAVRNKG